VRVTSLERGVHQFGDRAAQIVAGDEVAPDMAQRGLVGRMGGNLVRDAGFLPMSRFASAA